MPDKDPMRELRHITYFIGVMVVMLFLAALMSAGRGCSIQPDSPDVAVNVTVVNTSTETATETEPQTDTDTETDTETGTGTGTGTGTACVSFDDVRPILTSDCVSCHAGLDQYSRAKAKSAEINRRTHLDSDNPQHMPKGSGLEQEDIDTIGAWVTGGTLETCPVVTPPDQWSFKSFDDLETTILDDLGRIDANDRLTVRYLVTLHRLNAKAPVAEVLAYAGAASKGINSLSFERNLAKPTEVAPGVFRIDLEDYGLSAADWQLIEAGDRIDVESFTSRGELIKVLVTGSGPRIETRKPWVHVDNFNDVVFRNSGLYHDLTETPQSFLELTTARGVDYKEDLADFDALLTGLGQSPLAPHNRLLSRHESDDGAFWVTYDTGALDAADKNLFQFPLLKDAGGQRNFRFVASEVIYHLPNGLLGFALFNAAGARQDVAPVDVVRDFENPVSAEIRNAASCFRCHRAGLIPATDQIRAHVLANGSEFGADKDIALALYRGETERVTLFADDNLTYRNALAELGITGVEDPITIAADRFLTQWDLAKTAAFVFLTEADMRQCIEGSSTGKAQLGQLLSGGTVTYDQVVATLPVLKRDCRLFQDPLVGGA